jgi:hypothetical protein
MHLTRDLRYDGPWLQLMPDSAEDNEALESLAAAGVRTCGPATEKEEQRLRAIWDETTRRPAPRHPEGASSSGRMPAKRYDIVVRREHRDVFDTLRHVFGAEAVRWDRRRGDRRVAAVLGTVDRRDRDRREPPARRWGSAGFAVAWRRAG